MSLCGSRDTALFESVYIIFVTFENGLFSAKEKRGAGWWELLNK